MKREDIKEMFDCIMTLGLEGDEAIDYIDKMIKECDGWISVEDAEKPLEMQTVLLGDKNDVSEGYFSREADESYFSATGENSWKFKRKNPTHWMPLPSPPAK